MIWSFRKQGPVLGHRSLVFNFSLLLLFRVILIDNMVLPSAPYNITCKIFYKTRVSENCSLTSLVCKNFLTYVLTLTFDLWYVIYYNICLRFNEITYFLFVQSCFPVLIANTLKKSQHRMVLETEKVVEFLSSPWRSYYVIILFEYSIRVIIFP